MSGSMWQLDELSRLVHPKWKSSPSCASENEVQEARRTMDERMEFEKDVQEGGEARDRWRM